MAVINIAQSESRRLSHQYVGTEQILLGLVSESSNASEILNAMGVNLENAQIEVEKIIGRGNKLTPIDIPFTSRAKQVLELSVAESQKLGHNYIGTEHLLLGILREGARSIGQGVAIKVLQNLRVDLVSLEQQLQAALS
ncbi:hypothetical protein IQ243_13680 [Nostocales cyanobacterium LEGE 11386]|nr:hypothetical protein [Nostocales cyanobacterium LEGE 11386]